MVLDLISPLYVVFFSYLPRYCDGVVTQSVLEILQVEDCFCRETPGDVLSDYKVPGVPAG